jgi:hypothetical protein
MANVSMTFSQKATTANPETKNRAELQSERSSLAEYEAELAERRASYEKISALNKRDANYRNVSDAD